MPRSDRWCFTENLSEAWRPAFNETEMLYLVWEIETAPTTGRQHVQGYVRFRNKKMLQTVKNLLHSNDIHLETARGSEQQNRDYCLKEVNNNPDTEHGEEGTFNPEIAANQGRRTDLEEVSRKVLEPNAKLGDIARENPVTFVRNCSGLVKLFMLTREVGPLTRTISTTWLWGETGVGKTHRVRTTYPEAFVVKPGRDPFGMYSGEKVILFDEWSDQSWTLQDMNFYLDTWATKLDSRYYDKVAQWTKVFIISNTNPSLSYPYLPERLRQAFFRRINYTIEILSRNQELLLL